MFLIRYAAVIAVLSGCLSASAQMPGAGNRPPDIGHVYGKVTDSTGKAVSDAAVYVLQARYDSASRKSRTVLVKGSSTASNGEFSMAELPIMGKLRIRIAAIGYQPYEQDITFMNKRPGAFDKDLGNIRLAGHAKQLAAVNVTVSKPLMEMNMDRKTFHVDRNIVSAGGTAVDVMRNVPSVQVDMDGNVKMRNAVPQIYIDGRPTTLTLDQIPANGIASVEVITNPSARYDASGGNAGILNIVLKKNRQKGYNGNVTAGVDSRGGYNGGINFNMRQGKFNFSAMGMTNQVRNLVTGTTNRHTASMNIFQDSENRTTGGFSMGKLGLDYFVSNRTTLSVSGLFAYGKFKPREIIDMHADSGYSRRLSNSDRVIKGTTLQAGMKHNFPRPGEEWTIDVTYSVRNVEGDGLNTTAFTDKATLQKSIMDANNKLWILQTDYVKPFSESSRLEAGLRAQINPVSNNNENYIQYPGANGFEKIETATTDYRTTNNVYAAYASFSGAVKRNFGYQIGLRAESSNYTGELLNTGEKFSNNYDVSLFPSLFLSQQLKGNQQLQLSLTRRINRPTFFQLTPYVNYTDDLNITMGNPDLAPEFTSAAEFSYSKKFSENNTFLATAYYRHTNDLITRYFIKGINPVTGKEAYINTFINARSGDAYGAEFTSVNAIQKWWDVTTNVNVYNSRISTGSDGMWSVFAKVNNNFKLPENFTIQLSADYQSRTNLPVNTNQGFGPPMQVQSASQGFIRAFYGVDVAVKKTFLKDNAAAVTLSVNDIFRSRKSDQYSEGPDFTQDHYRLNNPQIMRLNFSYRFGKVDMSIFKRKNMKNQGVGNMQEM